LTSQYARKAVTSLPHILKLRVADGDSILKKGGLLL
jgi:hypothetical protein